MREVMLEMISNQPDIQLVAEAREDKEIIDLVSELSPDWLFIALEHPDQRPDVCDLLFKRFPNLKILALASGKNNCILYWANLTIRSSRVESSEKGILDVLRGRRPTGSTGFVTTGSKKVN